MKLIPVALATLLLSSAAAAQSDGPELAPLVPLKAAPAKKAQKKAGKKKPAVDAAAKPAEQKAAADVPLPALVPLAEPPPLVKLNNAVGVLAPAKLAPALRAVAQLAPLTQTVLTVDAPAQACDDGCLGQLAAGKQVDQLVVASFDAGVVRVRTLDVVSKLWSAPAEGAARGDDEGLAMAESLACKLLVPAGCTGELGVQAPSGVALTLDGKPIAKQVAVGVHLLEARSGTRTAQRSVAILRERAALYTVDRDLRILAAGEAPPKAPVAAVAAATTSERSPWVKRGGYALLGAGVAAAAAGVFFGVKSRSDINSAETAFRDNGGVLRPGDAATLRSGNSEAKNANILYAASAACLVTGALLTFAF